ncbi:hypothetical protein U8C35_09645 [Sinorhizobium medicae]|uniref:hypothetical protein n=1 Tax=Sinorhizobium medicae TaxID=110321 RepID=UPI002AF6CBBF|nr:hypothetical protein [Sinorhizobium medicae]WQO60634.1 hypothetical protein U8C35_09645 [Sinorhizobium medicae]
MTTALTTLSTLQQQITATAERLRPCGDDGVAKALKTLQTAGLALSSTIAPGDAQTVYSYALAGLSHEALTTTCKKLIRGEYNIDRKAFIPIPAELAAMVRAEQRLISEEHVRLRDTIASIELSRPENGTTEDPEARARVRKMLEGFRSWHQGEKEKETGGYVPEMPPSPEEIERWKKIMDLPDARSVSAEQMAYRRKIGMDIDAVEPAAEERAA